jgi:hypothetical protein
MNDASNYAWAFNADHIDETTKQILKEYLKTAVKYAVITKDVKYHKKGVFRGYLVFKRETSLKLLRKLLPTFMWHIPLSHKDSICAATSNIIYECSYD